MGNVIRSEWLKLRTIPLHLILWGIAGGFVLVITLLVAILNGQPESFENADLATLVGGTSIVAGLLVSVVSALAIASEFAHNTMRPTLAATPSRVTVFTAKAIVLAVVGAVIGFVISAGAYLVGLIVFNIRGASIGLSGSDGSLAVVLGIPVLFTILALFGYALGLLLRNSPAAVAIAILWPLLVETVLGGVLSVANVDEPELFLPYQSGLALISPETSDFGHGRITGALFFAVVVLALLAIAMVTNRRRDV